MVQRGKMQWPSRSIDELAHPGGWVVDVDGVAALHVQDGLDDDLVVADPVADLGQGGGAELLDLPGREGGAALGVDVEVGGVDAGVDLDLRFAGRLGLAGGQRGDGAEGLDLPGAEGVGVAVEVELVGDGADQVVERP